MKSYELSWFANDILHDQMLGESSVLNSIFFLDRKQHWVAESAEHSTVRSSNTELMFNSFS